MHDQRGWLQLQVARASDRGGRDTNQDALSAAEHGQLVCHVVADGAGGHAGGALAANLVVQAVADGFSARPDFNPRALQAYLTGAETSVAQAQSQAGMKDMSSTVAALLVDRGSHAALWGHLGDTRLYLFRNKTILAATADHSLVQQYIAQGYCDPAQARTHPQRHILYAAIGASDDTLPEVTPAGVALQDGDALLLCTDGLWEWVLEAEMEAALARAGNAQTWLEQMEKIAAQRSAQSPGARDNTTVVAIFVRTGGAV
jgi:serine/threonine protein phosphatase PrpC